MSNGNYTMPAQIPVIHRSMNARCRRLDDVAAGHRAFASQHRGMIGQHTEATRAELEAMQSMAQQSADTEQIARSKAEAQRHTMLKWADGVRQTYPQQSNYGAESTSLGASLAMPTATAQFGSSNNLWGSCMIGSQSEVQIENPRDSASRNKIAFISLDDDALGGSDASVTFDGNSSYADVSLAGTPASRIFHHGPRWNPTCRVASSDPATPLVLPEQAAAREQALFGRAMRKRPAQPKLRVLSR